MCDDRPATVRWPPIGYADQQVRHRGSPVMTSTADTARVREGGDWRTLSAELFDGKGSWGNGAAMRVAPLGAWFANDLPQTRRPDARERATGQRSRHGPVHPLGGGSRTP
ncbi:ADP-ribosylglycohydrolase family protein [Nonomuraea angiospora]|uniref:ADP-ribosylglycohydrolase family protein n=1 Tax=Nonomuraea angiospora TaxID=46172 RepID=UPI003327DF5C